MSKSVTVTLPRGKTFEVTRSSGKGEMYWKATCQEYFALEDAGDIQSMCGFDPAGYGFFSFTLRRVNEFLFVAEWRCQTSCD